MSLKADLLILTTEKKFRRFSYHYDINSSKRKKYTCQEDIITTVPGLSIFLDPQQVTKKIPNAALQTLIKKLSTGEARKCVDNIYNNYSNGTNTKELLDIFH